VFQIRQSLAADPDTDPGVYLHADSDLHSGFFISDHDPRSFLPKNKNKIKIKKIQVYLSLFCFLIYNTKRTDKNPILPESKKIG